MLCIMIYIMIFHLVYSILYSIIYSMVYGRIYTILYNMIDIVISHAIYHLNMVCTMLYHHLHIFLNMRWQDCVCLIAPYPYNPNQADQFDFPGDMDLTGEGLLWYARPQLFFRCSVAPTGQLTRRKRHVELSLVFFSTFEPISLTPDSVMQQSGIPMLFDSASSSKLPNLYLCRAENVLGRVPLMPCYIDGNSTPTLPYHFRDRDGAAADTSKGRGNGSRLYEINVWMWRYGRGQPRTITVAEAEKRRKERTCDARQRAAQTMKRRREERRAAADSDMAGDSE